VAKVGTSNSDRTISLRLQCVVRKYILLDIYIYIYWSIRCTRFACCVPKATNTHSQYLIIIVFLGNNGYTNAPQCYVIRTMNIWFQFKLRHLVVTCNYPVLLSRICFMEVQ